jgi:hypothetical protein
MGPMSHWWVVILRYVKVRIDRRMTGQIIDRWVVAKVLRMKTVDVGVGRHNRAIVNGRINQGTRDRNQRSGINSIYRFLKGVNKRGCR